MDTMNKLLTATIITVAFAGLATASAAELTIFPQESSARIDSFTSFELEVENTGPVKDSYELTSTSPREVRIAPTEVELEPGTSETVNVWYNPDVGKEEGEYSFQVEASSRATDRRYTEEALVNVIMDHRVEIEVDESSRSVCRDEKATYELEVTNTGIQREEFEITTEFGDLSRNMVNLEDNETTTVTLTASSGEEVDRNFNVVAASTTSYAQDIQSMEFESVTCWASDTSVTPENQRVAAGTEARFDVRVSNQGTEDDLFRLSSSKGELEDSTLEIDSGSSETTELTVSTENLGEQTVTIRSESEVNSSDETTLSVYNGMDVSVTGHSGRFCEDEEASVSYTVENTGETRETFSLSTDRGNLSKEEVTLDSGSSENIEVGLGQGSPGEQAVRLTAEATSFGEPAKDGTATATVEDCWNLEMNVVPEVASAGENTSVIYRIDLENTGTEENTYELSHVGPEWIEIKPKNLTVNAGESGNSYMYAGIPFKKRGEVEIMATATGTNVEETESVRLLVGEEIETAIESEEDRISPSVGDRITGMFSGIGTAGTDLVKLVASVIAGLVITGIILLR